MTAFDPRRVFLNIVATYGRSLVALVCGLFTARWMLMSLGPVDYGLFGVVGALIGFVAILNEILAGGVRRFYGIAIGRARGDEVVLWFRVAVRLHVIFAAVLMAVGYPVGSWMVQHFIDVPVSRVGDCLWVLRLSCAACFVGMVSVPFGALFTAKQEIAELTVYSLVQTLAIFGFLWWLVGARAGAENLVLVAAVTTSVSVGVNLVLIARAFGRYPECSLGSVRNFGRDAKELIRYSACNAVQAVAYLLGVQGMAIFVNKLCGPIMNGALAISNSVKNHSSQLSVSVQGAFGPVIAVAYGSGDGEKVRRLALRVSKLAVVSISLFVLPLAVELREVLALWLKTPPEGAWELCLMALALLVADAFGVGYRTAIYASGKIGRFALYGESVLLLILPVAGLLWWAGWGIWSFGGSYLLVTLANVGARLLFSRRILGTRVRVWLKELVGPAAAVLTVCGGAGVLFREVVAASFLRVVLTTAVIEALFLPMVWLWIFNAEERTWIKGVLWKR